MAELSPWLQLLNILAAEASGLRCIELGWGASFDIVWSRGLGDNLDFVRALGKIQKLEKLVIEGYYAKNWPAYLEEKMDVRLQAICGLPLREGREESERDTDDEKQLKWEKTRREMNEKNLQRFREYQQGTEDLVP